MQQNYGPFIGRMIDKYEGGYCWDKADPGGPTKYGITCYDLAEHRGQKMDSMARWAPIVQSMPRSEAEAIYRKKYAAHLFFDDLNNGKDCVLLDYGVNSGWTRPIKVARKLLKLEGPASMDTALIKAINDADPRWFINAVCQERLYFMHQIRNGTAWNEFGRGWQARVDDLNKYSLALVTKEAKPIAPDLSTVPTPKAQHEVPTVTNKQVTSSTAGGGVLGAAIKALDWPTELAIAAGVLVVVAVIGYVIYKQHKAREANDTVTLPPGVVHA